MFFLNDREDSPIAGKDCSLGLKKDYLSEVKPLEEMSSFQTSEYQNKYFIDRTYKSKKLACVIARTSNAEICAVAQQPQAQGYLLQKY